MTTFFRIGIAIVIFVAVVVWVEYALSWNSIFNDWRVVSTKTVLWLVLLTLVSHLLRAYRVYQFFGKQYGHSYITYVRISFIHNAINNLLPMRVGEASFPILMKKHFDLSYSHSGSGLLWLRLMDFHWLVLLMIFSLSIFWSAYMLLFIFPITLLTYWVGNMKFFTQDPKTKIYKYMIKVVTVLIRHRPSSLSFFIQIYSLTAAMWLVKLTSLTFILLGFMQLPFVHGLFAVIAADFSSVLPIHGLAGSGTYEAVMVAMLVPLGVGVNEALSTAINVHIFLLLVTLISVPIAILLPRNFNEFSIVNHNQVK